MGKKNRVDVCKISYIDMISKILLQKIERMQSRI